LDRKEDGTYEIHDYKTSSTLPNQAEIDQDKQLALYQLGIEPLWDDTSNIELVWHYLKFDKELRSKRDRNTLDKLKNEFLSMIHEIEATEKFEPKESTLCNWCGYQDLCPSKKHAFKVVTEKPEAFLEDGGVKLVNRFIEVKSKKKELENEETRIKEAIFSYAASEGVDVLIGSGHKLKLKLSTRPKYPSKSDDEARYDALVDLLKKSDLWEEVSVFNQSKLLKYLKENKLKEDLLNSIKSYEEIVEDKRIYASRLKDIEDER
jgi:putative RecB family exonuclease